MNLKSSLIALWVVIIWGSNFPVIKLGIEELSPFAFLTLRFFITGLIFLPFMKWPGWLVVRDLFIIGFLIGILHQGLMFYGLQFTGAGTMSILLQSQVIIATLIGWLFFKEQIGWRTTIGILLGFSGIVVLMGGFHASTEIKGYALGILSALFIALAYIRMRRLRDMHSPTFIALINITVAPIMLIMSLAYDCGSWIETLPQADLSVLAGTLAYQVFAISLGHMLWQKLLEKHPVSQVIPWCLLIPVFGVMGGILMLDETFTWNILVGGMMTLAGVGIVMVRRIQKNVVVDPESVD
ncbi:MAG: EamA family transporter [Alphaproteobacteria bacterium]|nr:EamA family transporter [Alphaproteobacteria bacterium]